MSVACRALGVWLFIGYIIVSWVAALMTPRRWTVSAQPADLGRPILYRIVVPGVSSAEDVRVWEIDSESLKSTPCAKTEKQGLLMYEVNSTSNAQFLVHSRYRTIGAQGSNVIELPSVLYDDCRVWYNIHKDASIAVSALDVAEGLVSPGCQPGRWPALRVPPGEACIPHDMVWISPYSSAYITIHQTLTKKDKFLNTSTMARHLWERGKHGFLAFFKGICFLSDVGRSTKVQYAIHISATDSHTTPGSAKLLTNGTCAFRSTLHFDVDRLATIHEESAPPTWCVVVFALVLLAAWKTTHVLLSVFRVKWDPFADTCCFFSWVISCLTERYRQMVVVKKEKHYRHTVSITGHYCELSTPDHWRNF